MYEKEKYDFQRFLNMDMDERIEFFGYHKQTDFAKGYGLKDKQLSEWKANPKFKKEVEKLYHEGFKDIIPSARKRLAQRGIEDGDVAALKEIMKITGMSIERTQQVSNEDISEVVQVITEIVQRVLSKHPELFMDFVRELEKKLGEM